MKIDEIEFEALLVEETLYSSKKLGKFKQTMTLVAYKENYVIEWYIPDIDICFEIGIWTENIASKKVIEYDGVFELPKQAKDLLIKNGFSGVEEE